MIEPLEKLRKLYASVLENPLFAGIDIATRPDCVGPDVIVLLCQLKEKYPEKVFFVELGFQTCHEKTAEFIRRGYDNETFVQAVQDLRKSGMDVIVHVILGLPYENEEMMLETIRFVNQQPQAPQYHQSRPAYHQQTADNLNWGFGSRNQKDNQEDISGISSDDLPF